MGNPIQFDYTVLLTAMLPMLFFLLLSIFVVYFMVNALRFFKHKEIADKELSRKIDELIKLQTQQSKNRS